MLKHPAPFAHRGQRSSEAAAIIAFDPALACSADPGRLPGPELAPSLARRMRHNRMRPVIEAGIALLISRVDALKPEVWPARLDVERCDHAAPRKDSAPRLRAQPLASM